MWRSEYSTNVFKWTAESRKRIVVHSGGTSSGKTYSIIEYLITLACLLEKRTITVAGQDRPNLRVGAYRDAEDVIYNSAFKGWYQENLLNQNKSNMSFHFKNGSVVEFNSYDDPQDAKSGKREFLFLNEANGVSYEVFEELQVRTSVRTILDFNPTAEFWAHSKLMGRDDVDWFNSTWRDNPFIKDSVRDKILSYEPTAENVSRGTADKYRWDVYGLGKVGRLEGLVFTNWERGSLPGDYKWRVFGLDFGYTNDPTALVEVRYSGGKLYVKEWIYRTGLTNQDIDREIRRLDLGKDLIIADSAEPKSIEELARLGHWIKGAVKGKDSINQGIDVLKRYKIIYEGENIGKELNSYIWAKDRQGSAMNKPIDSFNHSIDAMRYAVSYKVLHEKAFTSALI